ncbi:hypothetical protein WQ56_07095 [Luteimonas sp. FCS-9]|nr:hypothetical protein WQ56_07095 [Luteimonas sp. FCS-9]
MPGHVHDADGRRLVFAPRPVGTFRIVSGRIVACDPFFCEHVAPFDVAAPNGEFPLVLAVARDAANGDERVAFARLAFSQAPVVAWRPARVSGDGEVLGYAVDSGIGGFMDADARADYDAQVQVDAGAVFDRIIADMDATHAPTRSWRLRTDTRGSIALFSSGYGDGGYASYWGVDAAGRPVALLTDFQVVE